MTVRDLPTLNACLNGLAAIILLTGFVAIKNENRVLHERCMTLALIVSGMFLCSYVLYHVLIHGVTRYPGHGLSRVIYFSILITHTPLAMIIVPFSLAAIWFAHR